LIPTYLWIFIITVLIVPTLFSIGLRLSLYQQLTRLEKQVHKLMRDRAVPYTGVIEKIRSRFREASEKVEDVNTTAIIDGIFRQEKLSVFGMPIPWEFGDRFCRILPNLLLSLGLLGTFLGITLNLNHISATLNQVEGTEIDTLINQLQQPLQGMGIAFASSLVAVACSALLTITNLVKDTTALKLQIFSTLEDYLDNVYLPNIPSHSRLDRAVDRMVSQQQDFLTRFHDNVTSAVEASFGKVANQIAQENKEANDLARQVYERFTETAGTLSQGATQFQYAVESLETEITRLQQAGNQINQGANQLETAANKIEASQFSENLEELTASLAETQTNFAESTAQLQHHLEQLTHSNLHAADLGEQLSTSLNTFTDRLNQSATQFEGVASTIANSQFDQTILRASENLQTSQTQFQETITQLNEGIQQLNSAIAQTDTSSQNLNTASQQLTQFNQNWEQIATLNQNKLHKIQQSLYLLVKAIGQYQFLQKTVSGLDELQEQTQQLNQHSQQLINLNQKAKQTEHSNQEILRHLQSNLMELLTTIRDNQQQTGNKMSH